MAEYEELRLRVTLDDIASSQLQSLRRELATLGTGEQGAAFQRVTRQSTELTAVMRPLAQGSLNVRSAFTLMSSAIGPAGIAIAGLGFGLQRAAQGLNTVSRNLIELNAAGEALGVGGAQYDSIIRQLERMGITSQRATPFVTNLTQSVEQLVRGNSQIAQEMRQIAIMPGSSPDASARVEMWLQRITGAGERNDIATAINEWHNMYMDLTEGETSRLLAAGSRRRLGELWGLQGQEATIAQFRGGLREVSEEERQNFQQRLVQAQQYAENYQRVAELFKSFMTGLNSALLASINQATGEFNINEGIAREWGQQFGTDLGRAVINIGKLAEGIVKVVNYLAPVRSRMPRGLRGDQQQTPEQQAEEAARQAYIWGPGGPPELQFDQPTQQAAMPTPQAVAPQPAALPAPEPERRATRRRARSLGRAADIPSALGAPSEAEASVPGLWERIRNFDQRQREIEAKQRAEEADLAVIRQQVAEQRQQQTNLLQSESNREAIKQISTQALVEGLVTGVGGIPSIESIVTGVGGLQGGMEELHRRVESVEGRSQAVFNEITGTGFDILRGLPARVDTVETNISELEEKTLAEMENMKRAQQDIFNQVTGTGYDILNPPVEPGSTETGAAPQRRGLLGRIFGRQFGGPVGGGATGAWGSAGATGAWDRNVRDQTYALRDDTEATEFQTRQSRQLTEEMARLNDMLEPVLGKLREESRGGGAEGVGGGGVGGGAPGGVGGGAGGGVGGGPGEFGGGGGGPGGGVGAAAGPGFAGTLGGGRAAGGGFGAELLGGQAMGPQMGFGQQGQAGAGFGPPTGGFAPGAIGGQIATLQTEPTGVPTGVPQGSDVGPGAGAGAGETPAIPSGVGAGAGRGRVIEQQARVAGTRKLPLSSALRSQLDAASAATGLQAEVFSGGQAAKGTRGLRTGSTRHDLGAAADLKLRDPKTGRILSADNPQDQARMAEFVRASVQAGATGVGAQYMGSGAHRQQALHIGGGRPSAWGPGARAATAPGWLSGALQQGLQARRAGRALPTTAPPIQAGGGAAGGGGATGRDWGGTSLLSQQQVSELTGGFAADSQQAEARRAIASTGSVATAGGGGLGNIQDISGRFPTRQGGSFTPKGLVIHHTAGGGTPEGVMRTLQQRGLSVHYIIDREGNIVQSGDPSRVGYHAGRTEKMPGVGNQNMLGVEIIARNEKDVTPAQRAAAARLAQMSGERFGFDPAKSTFGHGELTGRKQATEGATARMIRTGQLSLPSARGEVDRVGGREITSRVDGTGTVNVDVNANKPRRVRTTKILKEEKVPRLTQMEEASKGPETGGRGINTQTNEDAESATAG